MLPRSDGSTVMAERTHESLAHNAAAYLAKSSITAQSLSGSPPEIRRQGLALVEWAKLSSVLLTEEYIADLDRYEARSSEHEVFYRARDNRAVKRTHPGSYGFAVASNGKHRNATPILYLERLLLMNFVFDTDLRLEGVLLDQLNLYNDGVQKPSIVVSQQWIDAQDENAPYATEQEIKNFMEGLGFSLLPDCHTKWKKDRFIVSDTREHNFIKSVRGLVPIDLLINKLIDSD
jgi:hypothetical protein